MLLALIFYIFYTAGRCYFFYEATPQKRHFTDDYLIERLHEIAEECTAWPIADSVWRYAITGILGEASGQIFAVTQEEQAYLESQERVARAELAWEQPQRNNESLDSISLVEYSTW